MNEDIQKKLKELGFVDSEDFRAQTAEKQRSLEMLRERNRRAEEYRRLMWLREHSMEAFLEDPVDVCFDPEGCMATHSLYQVYKKWCRERQILEHTMRSFGLFLKKNTAKYNLVYSANIPGPQGGHVRGYRGIREQTREEQAARYR